MALVDVWQEQRHQRQKFVATLHSEGQWQKQQRQQEIVQLQRQVRSDLLELELRRQCRSQEVQQLFQQFRDDRDRRLVELRELYQEIAAFRIELTHYRTNLHRLVWGETKTAFSFSEVPQPIATKEVEGEVNNGFSEGPQSTMTEVVEVMTTNGFSEGLQSTTTEVVEFKATDNPSREASQLLVTPVVTEIENLLQTTTNFFSMLSDPWADSSEDTCEMEIPQPLVAVQQDPWEESTEDKCSDSSNVPVAAQKAQKSKCPNLEETVDSDRIQLGDAFRSLLKRGQHWLWLYLLVCSVCFLSLQPYIEEAFNTLGNQLH
jgi:hypothetical protein